MTTYCYDCEFLEDGKTIELIPIGIVADDGREYYGICSDANWDRIRNDDWLMDNVVRHLPTHPNGEVEERKGFGSKGYLWGGLLMSDTRVKPKWCISNEVREFILAGSGPHDLWAYYAAYDHVALAQLFGKMIHLPKGIPMFTHELMQAWQEAGYGIDLPPKSADEHDALADARWNMELLNRIRAKK